MPACEDIVWVRTRDLIRQIAMEHELEIVSGKVARDHIYIFITYKSVQQISKIMQFLKGTSSRVLLIEFPHFKKQFWGKHLWAGGYMAISSGNIGIQINPSPLR